MTILSCLGCEYNGNDRFSLPCGHVFCEECCDKILSGYASSKSSSSWVYLQQHQYHFGCPACYSLIDSSVTSSKDLRRVPKATGLVVLKELSLSASKVKGNDSPSCKVHPNTSFTFVDGSGWVCKGCQPGGAKSLSTPVKDPSRNPSVGSALLTETFNPEFCGIHNHKITKMSLSCSPYGTCTACESNLPNFQGSEWFNVPSTPKGLGEKSKAFMTQFQQLEANIDSKEDILRLSSDGLSETIEKFERDIGKAHNPPPELSELFKKVVVYENERREILKNSLKAKGHQRQVLGKIKYLISMTEEFMSMKNFVRVMESIHFMNTLKENALQFSQPLSLLGYGSNQFLYSTKFEASATITNEPRQDQANRAPSDISTRLPIAATEHKFSSPVSSPNLPGKDTRVETSLPQSSTATEPYGGYGATPNPPPVAYTASPVGEGVKVLDDAQGHMGAEEAKKKDERQKSMGQKAKDLVHKGAARVIDAIHHVNAKGGKADTKVDDASLAVGAKTHEHAAVVGDCLNPNNPNGHTGLVKHEEVEHTSPIQTPAGGYASPSKSPARLYPTFSTSSDLQRGTLETCTPPDQSIGGSGKEGNSPKESPSHQPSKLLTPKKEYFVSIFSANESRKTEAMDKLKALHTNIIQTTVPIPLMHAFYVAMEQVAGKDGLKPGSFDFDSSVFHASKFKSIDIQILSDISSPNIQAHFQTFLDTYKVKYSKVDDHHILSMSDMVPSGNILLSNPFEWNMLRIEWSPLALYFRGITNMEIYQGLLSFFETEKIDVLSVTVEASQQSGERLVKVIFFNVKDILSVIALKKLQIGKAFIYISRDGKSFIGEERVEPYSQPQPNQGVEPYYKGHEAHAPPNEAPPRSDFDVAESYMQGHHTPAPPPPMETSFAFDDFRPDILSRYVHICDHVRSWEYNDKIWSPQAWLQAFQDYERRRKSTTNAANPRGNLDEVRPMRVLVMLNTIKLFRAGSYTNSNGQTILIPPAGQNSFYKGAPSIPTTLGSYKHKIQVVNMDCLEAARDIMAESRDLRNVAVLNMASKFTPGGGYKKGDAAQEENLFRRTNYCTQLDSAWESENPNMSAQGYPMDPLGGAYTKSVTVFRGLESDGYPLLDEAFQCDFVAVYAIKSERNRQFGMNEYHDTQKKIETILKICLHNGCEAVVLGALGCGAYNNPPRVVAQAFLSAMQEYGHFFKKIVFAVRDDHNSTNNFTIFRDTLDGVKIESGRSIDTTSAIICRFGGLCHDQGRTHGMQYRHPPPCSARFCTNRDEAHRFYFSH